jgi:hypothetical protein
MMCVMKTRLWLHIGLLGAGIGANAGSDLTNERLSATVFERERHWGVDCAALRSQVLGCLDAGAHPCAIEPQGELVRMLELCGAIHNVPGEASACPDYRAVAGLLREAPLSEAVPGDRKYKTIRKNLLCPD